MFEKRALTKKEEAIVRKTVNANGENEKVERKITMSTSLLREACLSGHGHFTAVISNYGRILFVSKPSVNLYV